LIPDGGGFGSVAFSPDSTTLYTSGRSIQAFEVVTGRLIWSGQLYRGGAPNLIYEPTLRMLVTAGTSIAFWNPVSGQRLRDLSSPSAQSQYASVAVLPGGNWLISSSAGLTLWDAASGQMMKKLGPELGRILSVINTSDHRVLAPAFFRKSVRVWDVAGEKIASQFDVVSQSQNASVIDANMSMTAAGSQRQSSGILQSRFGTLQRAYWFGLSPPMVGGPRGSLSRPTAVRSLRRGWRRTIMVPLNFGIPRLARCCEPTPM
jgi:WD40 repeat protein